MELYFIFYANHTNVSIQEQKHGSDSQHNVVSRQMQRNRGCHDAFYDGIPGPYWVCVETSLQGTNENRVTLKELPLNGLLAKSVDIDIILVDEQSPGIFESIRLMS